MATSKTIKEDIMYQGKIFQVVKRTVAINGKTIEFESAVRSPGTRIIIIKNGKMLITKEFRNELNCYDYRLPGGKVFDTLKEYKNASEKDILKSAESAAKKECKEEAGIIPSKIKHFATTKAGATVEWDLYYFIVEEFKVNPKGQELENGEIISVVWKTFDEVKKMCIDGSIKEDRSVGVLLKFLYGK